MFGCFGRSKKNDKKKKAGKELYKYEEPTKKLQQANDTDTNTCIVINGAGLRDITPSERKEGEGSSERSHRYHVEYHVDGKNDNQLRKVLKDDTSSRSSTHSSDEISKDLNGAPPMGIRTTAGTHGQDEMPDKLRIGQNDVKQTSQVTHELKKKKPHKPKHRHSHNNQESSDSETDSSSDSICDESPSVDDSNDSPVERTNRSKTKKKSRSTIINAPGSIDDFGKNNTNKIVHIAYGEQKKKKNKDTDRSSRSHIKGQADAISSCKESATMPTLSPMPEDTSKVKVGKLQKSLKEMTADDNGIQVRHLGRPSGSSAGNMRAQFNETESVFNQRVLVDLAKSIGIIKSPYGICGTGFRVGFSYIMTAKHVKDNILNAVPSQLCESSPPPRILHLNDVFIDFSYEVSIDDKQSIHTDHDNLKFYFEPKIVYENDNMDTVILQLKPNMRMDYPPPLTNFAELSDPNGQLYLIGHSKAEIKRTDKFSGVQLTNEINTNARQWSQRHIGIDGFTGIDNPQRVLLHCTFEKGASGSPGVWICNNNPLAFIVTMLLCGYPEWFYHDDCPLEKKYGIHHHDLVEQGVCMKSLCEDIKITDPDLWKEIFCFNLPLSQNDDVEMKSM